MLELDERVYRYPSKNQVWIGLVSNRARKKHEVVRPNLEYEQAEEGDLRRVSQLYSYQSNLFYEVSGELLGFMKVIHHVLIGIIAAIVSTFFMSGTSYDHLIWPILLTAISSQVIIIPIFFVLLLLHRRLLNQWEALGLEWNLCTDKVIRTLVEKRRSRVKDVVE